VPGRSLVVGRALEIGSTAGLRHQAWCPSLRTSWKGGQLATIPFVPPESQQDDPRPTAITELLQRWRGGSQDALEALIPALYQELLRIARAHMQRERPGHTLEPSALVNEAYARLVDVKLDWQDRVHFLSVASRTMRRVLVDHARARLRDKRAGGAIRVTLSDGIAQSRDEEILHLEDALEALGKRYPRKRDVVEMHFFGGLKYAEIAAAVGISEATVDRELRFAKAFLGRELAGGTQAEP